MAHQRAVGMEGKAKLKFIIITLFVLQYAMEEVWINPFSLWVLSPLIASFIWVSRSEAKSIPKQQIGFVLGSNLVLLSIHVMWFWDYDGIQTSSSTSALIFAVAPVYAFIIGGFFAFIGYLAERNNSNK